MSDYDDSQDHGHLHALSPRLDGSVQNQRRAGNQFTHTSTGALPPRKTAPPAVVMRKADGSAAAPLPFTGISADMAEWAFLPHVSPRTLGVAPQAPVQARGDMGGTDVTSGQRSIHESAAAGVSEGGSALPHSERIRASFGPAHDVSHVRAHVGGAAAVASEAIGAEAYATGNHIAFREAPDVHTAAHEAAHVIQQQQGVQLSGGVGQASDIYERHADAVADRVVAGQSAAELLTAGPTGGGSASIGDIGTEATQAKPATSAVQRQAQLGASVTGEEAPCAKCAGGDCECSEPSTQLGPSEHEPALPNASGLPPELIRYVLQLGVKSPENLSKEQVEQIGQLAKARMSEAAIFAVGEDSGIELPLGEESEQTSRVAGQPVQRQAGEAASTVAATMWWLTMVDGPLPIGDIAYGVLIATAAITASVAAAKTVETICSANLETCLNNPWQPDWNKDDFGPRKDCGACYRECLHSAGIWPSYKCPL